MSLRVEIKRHVVPADVFYIADHLREEDKRELETATGRTPIEAVFASWAVSEQAWVAYIDGLPAIVFGVAPGGVVWLVGTDAISRAALPVFRLSRRIVKALLDDYGFLHNIADCRNELHLRWLKLLGFTFCGTVEVNGLPFQRFYMKKQEDTGNV